MLSSMLRRQPGPPCPGFGGSSRFGRRGAEGLVARKRTLATWRPSDRETVRFGHLASPPQPLEAPACRAGVVDGMLRVAVAEVVLDQPQIMALVGEVVAAGVAQCVRVDA